MNLEEIGSFKNKVVSKLINDDNILDVLLGDVDNIEDPETALLGKDGSVNTSLFQILKKILRHFYVLR